MSQADLFPADPPARGIDHGGYMPGQTISWRGHDIPASYLFDWGFRTERLPTNTTLMDLIVEVVRSEAVSVRQLVAVAGATPFEVSKHLELMRDLGVIERGPWITEEQCHEIGLKNEGANQ